MAQSLSQVEQASDFGTDAIDATQARWCAELKLAKEYLREWNEKAKKIIKSYRDDRGKHGDGLSRAKRINLLYSNTQTLKPAVLAKKPKPVVTRRNNDSSPIALIAGQTLERCIGFVIDDDDFDYALFAARDDYILTSRGVVRMIFTADKNEQKDEMGNVLSVAVTNERVLTDYVIWDDFLHSPARTWSEVRWIAFKTYMTRDQLISRFGEEIGKAVTLDYLSEDVKENKDEDQETSVFKQACIYEIWVS